MKKIILWAIRKYANDRQFRIDICKELHNNAQTYFGDQSVYGRYYEACGEFFEAAPRFVTDPITLNGIISEYEQTAKKLSK